MLNILCSLHIKKQVKSITSIHFLQVFAMCSFFHNFQHKTCQVLQDVGKFTAAWFHDFLWLFALEFIPIRLAKFIVLCMLSLLSYALMANSKCLLVSRSSFWFLPANSLCQETFLNAFSFVCLFACNNQILCFPFNLLIHLINPFQRENLKKSRENLGRHNQSVSADIQPYSYL